MDERVRPPIYLLYTRNGLDVEPEARALQTFGFGCRIYSDAEGRRSGLPSISVIRRALTEAPTYHASSAGTLA